MRAFGGAVAARLQGTVISAHFDAVSRTHWYCATPYSISAGCCELLIHINPLRWTIYLLVHRLMVNIVLYDAPSAAPEAWAPNIWRVRFILNYKRLPYRTVWVEFHDVERASRAVNAPPISISRDGRPIYTLPVLIDSRSQSNTVVLTSPNVIAEYLEVTYPARPIFPPGSRALQSVFVQYLNEVVLQPLLPIMVPLSYGRLPPRAQAHFQGLSGMPGYMVAGPQRDQAWATVRDRLDQLSAMLDKNSGADGDGTVAMGHELSHADFAICSVLVWIERVSPNDGWVRIRQWSGGRWARLWERCSPFMEVQ